MTDASPPIIAFVGRSGSGKTTLIEKLVARLGGRGHRVGVIKHTHHEVDIDREGKDSSRFRKAGANPTVVTGVRFIGYMEATDQTVTLGDVTGYFEGKADIIIVEGFKKEAAPRFIFGPPFPETGAGVSEETLGYILMAGSDRPSHGRPVFHRDEVDGLADWIERKYLTATKES